jgi:hypothetical protein
MTTRFEIGRETAPGWRTSAERFHNTECLCMFVHHLRLEYASAELADMFKDFSTGA